MARPITISNERILDAARELFLSKGPGISTAAIAKRAGVSEGTLFKRYASKDQLFEAALEMREPAWLKRLITLVGTGDVKRNLVELSLEIVEFYRVITPLVITKWSRHLASKRAVGSKAPPIDGVRALVVFFTREIELGRLGRKGKTDPHVLARTLLGVLHKVAFQDVLGVRGDDWPSTRAFVEDFIDLLWVGIAP